MSLDYQLFSQVFFVIINLALFVFSVIGNSIVIHVIRSDKKLMSRSNYYILSMAVADLMIGLISMPVSIWVLLTGGPSDFHLCILICSGLLAEFEVSIFSLVAVSIDRYWAVCHPVTYHVKSTSSTKIIIASYWILGGVCGFVPLLGWNSGKYSEQCDIRVVADLNYLLFVTVFSALVAALIIVVLHVMIYRAILEHGKRRETIVANTTEHVRHHNEVRTANTLAMIVGTFLLLWLPGITSLLVMSITNNRDFHVDVIELSKILVHVNAAIDPIIYAYRMENIRIAMRKFLKCCFKDKIEVNRRSISTIALKTMPSTSSLNL